MSRSTRCARTRSTQPSRSRSQARRCTVSGSLTCAGFPADEAALFDVAAPTADEAVRFGAWVHDENQGSSGNEALANPEAAATIRYVVPEGLSQLPMQSVYWPYGAARAADPAIADAAMLHETGEIPACSRHGPRTSASVRE